MENEVGHDIRLVQERRNRQIVAFVRQKCDRVHVNLRDENFAEIVVLKMEHQLEERQVVLILFGQRALDTIETYAMRQI